MRNYPAITIKQPWATLIMLGIKDIENRSWITDYRGRIYIHAGQKWDDSPWPDDPAFGSLKLGLERGDYPLGRILGTVDLVNIVSDSTSPWAVKGQNHWVITNPSEFMTPLPWRGQMGLWYPTRFRTEANT